jgi:hypothetical protein
VLARDINGDGLLDLIVASAGGQSVTVLPGQGDGTFASGQPIALPIMPAALDVADVDGDGRLDLVVISAVPSQAILLLNQSQ